MSFSLAVFIAALWAIASEMAEDTLINFIYAQFFGTKRLAVAIALSSSALLLLSWILITILGRSISPYLEVVSKSSSILIGGIGVYWLFTSLFKPEKLELTPYEGKSRQLTLVAIQLVFVEELEIFLILAPLALSSFILESVASAALGILVSLAFAMLLRKGLANKMKERLGVLKIISGSVLILLSLLLIIT